jgi:hypothetical protein
MENWQCYYCEVGKVTALPADCPECKRHLTEPFDQMTEEKKLAAWALKYTTDPTYSLAS